MSFISYQVIHLECRDENKVMILQAMTSRQMFAAEMSFELDSWLLKKCAEKEFHIVRGFCDANCPLDGTYSGDEVNVLGDNDIHYSMSEICKPMTKDVIIEQGMYLCVAI